MREQQLLRRKTAVASFGDSRTIAKERHLEAELACLRIAQPSGHVPPLVAKRRVRTLVGGEAQRLALVHVGVADVRARSRGDARGWQQPHSPARRYDHQSPRTARTALMLVADRALPRAVNVASPT